MAEDWITTAEAAKLSGYHAKYIPRLIQAGKVEGRRFGHAWQVSRESLLEYLKKQEGKEKRGPKPKD